MDMMMLEPTMSAKMTATTAAVLSLVIADVIEGLMVTVTCN